MAACKDIDVRPTPMVDAMHEQLFASVDAFELTGTGAGTGSTPGARRGAVLPFW